MQVEVLQYRKQFSRAAVPVVPTLRFINRRFCGRIIVSSSGEAIHCCHLEIIAGTLAQSAYLVLYELVGTTVVYSSILYKFVTVFSIRVCTVASVEH